MLQEIAVFQFIAALGFDVNTIALCAIVWFMWATRQDTKKLGNKLTDLAGEFKEHEKDCKKNRNLMWQAINKSQKGVSWIMGSLGGKPDDV